MDRLRVAIARLARQTGSLAVLVMDLDRFKWVNDSLGHEAGDQLLVATARRIERAVRPTDVIARFGGDEFVVLCDDLDDERNALAVAERIQGALSVDFPIAETQIRVSASVGIVTSRDAATKAEGLLRDADVAMYRAKELGKGRCEPFDRAMRDALEDRLAAEQDLRRAIGEDELLVYYQPIVNLSDGSPVGAEALLRWRHPSGEVMAPGQFIGLAEETGLIGPIGDFVAQTACEQLARWNPIAPAGQQAPMVHVNLSARQLIDPSLVSRIARILAAAGANPSQLCLELTETAFLVDEASCLERLKALKTLGVSLCVDDFGTGYSSLSHLTKFPIDVVRSTSRHGGAGSPRAGHRNRGSPGDRPRAGTRDRGRRRGRGDAGGRPIACGRWGATRARVTSSGDPGHRRTSSSRSQPRKGTLHDDPQRTGSESASERFRGHPRTVPVPRRRSRGCLHRLPGGRPYYANRESARLLGRGVLPTATDNTMSEAYQVYVAGTNDLYPVSAYRWSGPSPERRSMPTI